MQVGILFFALVSVALDPCEGLSLWRDHGVGEGGTGAGGLRFLPLFAFNDEQWFGAILLCSWRVLLFIGMQYGVQQQMCMQHAHNAWLSSRMQENPPLLAECVERIMVYGQIRMLTEKLVTIIHPFPTAEGGGGGLAYRQL